MESESSADVYPRTPGLVEEIYVEEGDRVRKGSALSRLDDREYSIDEAETEPSSGFARTIVESMGTGP